MDEAKIILSLAALLGALIGSIVTIIVNKYKVDSDLRKHREFHFEKIFDIRIKIYPKFYKYLSLFAKKIQEQSISDNDIIELRETVSAWESESSIFVSPITERMLIQLRILCDKCLRDGYSKKSLNRVLKRKIWNLEFGLKTELGVFQLESYHRPHQILNLRAQIDKLYRENEKSPN